MNHDEIRLIAMDMDGTLLDADQRLSQENITALKDAAKAGIHIAICSGRLAGDSGLFTLDAGLSTCHIISLNGAYCLESPFGKAYATHFINGQALQACLQILSEYEIAYACYWPQGAVVMESGGAWKIKNWGAHKNRPGAPEYAYGREALDLAIPQGICKVVYMEERSPELLLEIKGRLESIQGLDVTSSWENNLELMPAGINKGAAVKELAERLGISAASVMVIGDYDNDLPMLEYAGVGVAMGNASQAVKDAARYVTLSNGEHGVAHAIRKWALNQ